MHRLVWLRLAALLIGLGAAPAIAQDSTSAPDSAASSAESTVPEDLQALVGDWSLALEDEGQPTCPLAFTDSEAIGGWAVEVPETCPAPYPAADQLAAWNVDDSDGSIILLDAERHVVLRLFEDEDGLYDTAPDSTPRFYLLAPYDAEGAGGEADSD